MNFKISNEDLAVFIKNGDDGYMPQLWEQVRLFIANRAYRLYNRLENKRGLEAEDLVQQGYFAVLEVVRYYEPEKEWKFTTYLGNTLKKAWRDNFRINAVDIALSLDSPMSGENEDFTLLDKISAELADESTVDGIDESAYNRDLRKALDNAMKIVSEKQRRSIQLYYYFDVPPAEIANREGTTR